MIAATVPGGNTSFAKWFESRHRFVLAAELRIGSVGKPVQGLGTRHCIGNVFQFGKRPLARAIIEIEPAAAP